MNIRCCVCNSKSMCLLEKDGYKLYKCLKCGLIFVHPAPDQQFLSQEIYSAKNRYQSYKKNINLSSLKESKKVKRILDFLDKMKIKGKILDVGCSSGEFLLFIKRRGFDAYGVEINKVTADVARKNGLNVLNCFLEEAKFADNYFSVIMLGDVIEHAINPGNLLKECGRILKDNGVLIISAPNLNSFWSEITFVLYKLFKIPWSSITPPYHLYYFSDKNLNLLLSKFLFTNIECWIYGSPKLKYELGMLHLLKKFKADKKFRILFFMAFSYFLYSIFYFIDFLLKPFLRRDFSMIYFYKKSK